ncbi:MAG: T9SS type A sorting domain-containing protein [Bacteroidota bacterium]
MTRLLLLLALASSTATAQTTFIVTTTDDQGAGSLRRAIQDANNNSGADVIAFDIPGDGPHTVALTTSLPAISDPVTIDGLTQPGADCSGWPATLRVVVDGSRVNSGAGLFLSDGSDGSVVRGLVVNGFDFSGSGRGGGAFGITLVSDGNAVECSYIGTTVDGTAARGNEDVGVFILGSENRVGGPDPSQRNLVSGNGIGIEIDGFSGASGTLIQGNYIGTDATGSLALSNTEDGILIDGSSRTTIGGDAESEGNLISGNGDDGIDVSGEDATSTTIQFNHIGTTVDGTAALGNSGDGVDLNDGASNNDLYDNVISGNGGNGVVISGTDTQNNVLGRNTIGTNADGANLGNGDDGVRAVNSGPQVIGGTYDLTGLCCEGNDIAFNGRNGVVILAETSVSFDKGILGNRIYQNAGLGIDLQDDGPTPNDPGDADGSDAANRLQNFPDIAEVGTAAVGDSVYVIYAVDSDPSLTAPGASTYPLRIEFFLADADGEEGRLVVGRDRYTEDDYGACVGSGGTAPCPKKVWFEPTAPVVVGDDLVATATDTFANTSEFSGARRAAVSSEGSPAVDGLALWIAPNPTRGPLAVTLQQQTAGPATVSVFDALGREVAALHEGPLAAGEHALALDTTPLPAGVYVVRAVTPAGTVSRAVTVAR